MSNAYDAATLPPGWEGTANEYQRQGMPAEDAQRVAIAQGLIKQGHSPQDALNMAQRLIAQAMQRTKPIGLQGGASSAMLQQPGAAQGTNPMQMMQAAKGIQGLLGTTNPTAASSTGFDITQLTPSGFVAGGV